MVGDRQRGINHHVFFRCASRFWIESAKTSPSFTDFSREAATDRSPRRKPGGTSCRSRAAPEGRQKFATRIEFLSPLRGWCVAIRLVPRLTPGATICRPAGAEDIAHRGFLVDSTRNRDAHPNPNSEAARNGKRLELSSNWSFLEIWNFIHRLQPVAEFALMELCHIGNGSCDGQPTPHRRNLRRRGRRVAAVAARATMARQRCARLRQRLHRLQSARGSARGRCRR